MTCSRSITASLLSIGLTVTLSQMVSAFDSHDTPKEPLACFGEACAEPTAVRYLGDVCWNAEMGESGVPIRVGVTHMGGGRFALNGVIGAEEGFAITGNVVRIRQQWAFTLIANGEAVQIPVSGTATVDAAGATLMSGTLDLKTLDGTIAGSDATGFSQDFPGFTSGLKYDGAFPLKRVPCR
jgi:hypothetical protein